MIYFGLWNSWLRNLDSVSYMLQGKMEFPSSNVKGAYIATL